MTELRRRMIQDMQLHGFSPKTQKSYVAAVKGLANYFGRSPDLLSEEDLRDFFLHLINEKKAARVNTAPVFYLLLKTQII